MIPVDPWQKLSRRSRILVNLLSKSAGGSRIQCVCRQNPTCGSVIPYNLAYRYLGSYPAVISPISVADSAKVTTVTLDLALT